MKSRKHASHPRVGFEKKMTYFADLTKYEYLKSPSGPDVLNVGWLDRDQPFSTGNIPVQILDRLFDLCLNPMNKTRGYHQCGLCPQSVAWPITCSRNGRQIHLGSAEIHVPGTLGRLFVAPDMIYHYVTVHGYMPPTEFINAVMKSEGTNQQFKSGA